MMKHSMINRTTNTTKKPETVTLKVVAESVGLTAGTVSLVLNNAPQSISIPQQTKDRVFAAARKLNYQPNLFARALRTRQIPAVSGAHGLATGSRALVFEGGEHFLRAVNAIRQAGLRVPGDVAVVGAADISPAALDKFGLRP
jgi:DNA-binding LacI/PurR family transcriptional regulator